MAWRLIPCLVELFAAFDRVAPARDHASDGAVGDAAHQAEVSDHNPDETGSVPIHDADNVNEVHAIDVDDDLREPGLTMEMVVQFLLGRCRSGAERRLRYIIYNRRIWSASSGWVQRPYTGASPHTEHAHFSASYVTALEASTASWHLEDIPVALTDADKAWISGEIAKRVDARCDTLPAEIVEELYDSKIENEGHPGRTFRQYVNDDSNERGYGVGDKLDGPNAGVAAGSPLDKMTRAAEKILAE